MTAQSPLGQLFAGTAKAKDPLTPTTTPKVPGQSPPPLSDGKKRGADKAGEEAQKRARTAAAASDLPSDLRAVQQQASRGLAGSIPPFTAECFHHFTQGSQYDWPSWLRPEHLKDSSGKKPSEPGYNQSTLWIPKEQIQKSEGHGTPMLLQYWKVKSAHFDKVALFKVGKFYEVFYYDAFFAQQVCNLKWMSGEKKPHVGFPEMAKHEYAKLLVDAGYKVVVVEQVERVAEKAQRKESKENTGPNCIQREPCEVFTKGTVVDPGLMGGSGARFMTYLHFEGGERSEVTSFSTCLVDCATSQIQVGRINDGPDRNALRTLLAQVQPSEVLYNLANMPAEVLGMLRRLPCRPQLSPLYGRTAHLASRATLEKYKADHPGKVSEAMQVILKEEGPAIAAGETINYLNDILLGPRVLPFATWDSLELLGGAPNAQASAGSRGTKRMVLDATALSALEVLETLEGTYKGSLLEFLDHTVTPFGFRLLKQWICAPLLDVEDIARRHEAVEFFISHQEVAEQVRSGLKKIQVDLERATSRVWGYAVQSERNAVMYEDVTAKRLGDFIGLLRAYEDGYRALRILPKNLPMRLAQVCRTKAEGGVFPDLQAIITKLCDSVVAVPNPKGGADKHRPKDGVDPAYDRFTKEIKGVSKALEQELQRIQGLLPGVQLQFMHRMPAFRFEVECDDFRLSNEFREAQQLDITYASKNGKTRFHTPAIKELLVTMETLENNREDCIFPFLSKLFQEFYAHQAGFRAAVRLLAEVDTIVSLAVASKGLIGSSCNPEFLTADPKLPTRIELRNARHPVAAAKMGTQFVPNDTLLNTAGVPGVLVVTGPNMGGKSTVLRQTCIAAIMAQLGCRVNAVSCKMVPVDRIFTRIGSFDMLLEGKSTLLTELEETAAILGHATNRSLAVIDELGRGTSTFDGAAIASAVLKELTEKVGCLVMFATHYHPVSREATKSPQVAPFHMAAELDTATNNMTFLYRFVPGLSPASHGHNVAKLAGLPPSVLSDAVAKSAEFERGEGEEGEARRASKALLAEVVRLAEANDTAGLHQLYKQHCQGGLS